MFGRWSILRWAFGSLAALAAGCGPWERPLPPLPAEVESVNVVSAPNVTLTYYRAGEIGRARIILIHGSPGRGLDWGEYLRDPIPGFEVIAVDRPGYGQTLVNDERQAIPDLVTQAAVLDPLLAAAPDSDGVLRFPILVGHSYGGAIAARAAADRPDRVSGLVLLAGAFDPELIHPHWFNYLAANPALDWVFPQDLQISNDELFACYDQLVSLSPALGRIECPTILVQGTADWLAPPGNVEFFKRNAGSRNVESMMISGADHFLPSRYESDVREAIGRMVGVLGGQ